jgi:hypothetical protein
MAQGPPRPLPIHGLMVVSNHQVLLFPQISLNFKSTRKEKDSPLSASTWPPAMGFCNSLPYLLINSNTLTCPAWMLLWGTQRIQKSLRLHHCHQHQEESVIIYQVQVGSLLGETWSLLRREISCFTCITGAERLLLLRSSDFFLEPTN